MRKAALAIVACLLVSGCGFLNNNGSLRSPLAGQREDSAAHPAKPRNHPIEVFETKPERSYEVLNVIKGDSLDDLKYKARRCGADAIILQGSDAQAIAWKP